MTRRSMRFSSFPTKFCSTAYAVSHIIPVPFCRSFSRVRAHYQKFFFNVTNITNITNALYIGILEVTLGVTK